MSKYILILLTVLQSFSIQAMSRITSQASKVAGLRPVAALGLKNPVKAVQPQQVRHIVDVIYLASDYASMPNRAFSPLHGAIAYENGSIKKMLKTECPEIAAKFFNELDGRIRFTVYDHNPAIALNPELIGELLKELQQGTLYANKEVIASGPLGQKWHELYVQQGKQPLKVSKTFAKAIKKLITALEELKDDGKVRQLLLTALYVKAESSEEVTAYLKKIEVKQSSEIATSNSRAYAARALILIKDKNKNHLNFLKAPDMSEGWKGLPNKPLCAEKALWTVVNALLYNHETGCLDLSLLSESVQKSCNPAFKAFIETYPNLQIKNYYSKECKHTFLPLIWGNDKVKYMQQEGQYELSGSAESSLILLNHLFGTQAQSYTELATILSSEARTVQLTDCKEYGDVQVMVRDNKNREHKTEGTWNFSSGHVFLRLKGDNKNKYYITREYLDDTDRLEKAEQQKKGTLLRLIDGFIEYKIETTWISLSVEKIQRFFDEYEITQEEIQAPIKGFLVDTWSLLHKAVNQRRLDLVQFYLEKGISADTLDSSNNSPLEYMWFRNVEVSETKQYIQLLLPLMHDQEQIKRCLERVIDTKNLSLIEVALDAAVHVDKTQCNELMRKVVNNNAKEVFTLLLKKGFSFSTIDSKDQNGWTLLYRFIYNKNNDWVKLLIEAGADVNWKDEHDYTCLHRAVSENNRDGLKLLLMTEGISIIDSKNVLKRTALYDAVRSKKNECVALLIDAGADIHVKNEDGDTYLHTAVTFKNIEAIRLLVKKGLPVDSKGKYENTALYDAIGSKKNEIVKALINAGADINWKDKYGNTYLHTAADSGDAEAITLLIKEGLSVNVVDKYGRTPLDVAVMYKRHECIEILRAAGGVTNV